MYDLKTWMSAKFLAAMAIAILIYGVLSPIVSWYLSYTPTLITCSAADTFCNTSNAIISYVIPIGILFVCVISMFEVFSDEHRF